MTIKITDIKKEKIYDVLATSLGFEPRDHQRQMFCYLADDDQSKKLLLAPRCSGKTTVSIIYTIYKLLEDPNNNILFISHTRECSSTVKKYLFELIDNNKFLTMFGEINTNNIDIRGIYDDEKIIEYYTDTILHDIGVDGYNRGKLLFDKFESIPSHIMTYRHVIGTQSNFYDFYRLLQCAYPFIKKLHI